MASYSIKYIPLKKDEVINYSRSIMVRKDIQCLRGIAIIGVIVFHLYPSYFPNGYLGVDIFFVISGYLMSVILQKQKLDIRSISEFYYKRIKRIYPIYYLIILLILLFKQYLLADVYWSINNNYGIFSMIFLTNQKIIHDRSDYFNEFKADKSSVNLFIHCWSLSVEIQFYILVPFIFLGLQLFEDRRAKIIITCIISIASYSISFISVDPNFNFNFMFARIWQFAAGIIVTMIARNDKSTDKFKQLHTVACITLVMIFYPIKIHDGITRLIITITTSFIIYNQYTDKNVILSSKLLSYIGDLSYILYLVHWPIINFFKLYHNQLLTISLILIISIIIHHTLEQWTLRLSIRTTITIILSLFILNCSLLYTLDRYPTLFSKSYSEEVERIIENNMDLMNKRYWLSNKCEKRKMEEYPNGYQYSFGHCKYENGNGTQKVLLLGNSYTLNQAETIRRAFNGNYSTFEYVSFDSNFAIFNHNLHDSLKKVDVSKRVAASINPDVIFIIVRLDDSQYSKVTENDEILKNMNRHLQFYQNVTNRIYILGSFPSFPSNFLNNYVSSIKFGVDDGSFQIEKMMGDQKMRYARYRLENLDCSKCEVYELGNEFLRNGYYYGYNDNKSLSYFDNDNHFTNAGLRLIQPFYDSLVQKYLSE